MMSARVLVIEDDEDFRELIVEYLEVKGHEVRQGESLAEAIREVQGGFTPTVAVIDWTLPDATGFIAYSAMHELVPTCTFIISTGHSTDITDIIEGHVHAVLRKPFRLTELAKAVDSSK